jgi:hypothetical protein
VTHLDADRLADLDEGLLPAAEADEAQSHLQQCPECSRLHEDLVAVQELLAQAPTPVIPDALVARLDAAIAAESSRRSASSTVTSLHGAHSRRRVWLPRALVAAAAVTIVALVGQSVLDRNGGGDDHSETAAADTAGAAGSGPAPQSAPESGPEYGNHLRSTKAVRLDSARFAQSVRAQVADKAQPETADSSAQPAATSKRCVRAALGADIAGQSMSRPARLDGRPVTLVLDDSPGGLRAWAVSCVGSPHVVDTARIPSR